MTLIIIYRVNAEHSRSSNKLKEFAVLSRESIATLAIASAEIIFPLLRPTKLRGSARLDETGGDRGEVGVLIGAIS